MEGVGTAETNAADGGMTAQQQEQRLEEEFFKFFMESEMIDDIFEDIDAE